MTSLTRSKTKKAGGTGQSSPASSVPYDKLGPVVKSQITVYYFGRFDCAPFNIKELLAPAPRCPTQTKLLAERRLQRAMAAVAAEDEAAEK